MKKQLLITANRSLGSKYIFHTICDISEFLIQYRNKYELIFLTDYASEKSLRRLFEIEKRYFIFDKVIFLSDFFKDEMFEHSSSWQDIYNMIDISKLKNIYAVLEIGSGISEGAKIKAGKLTRETLLNNKQHFTFISIRLIKQKIILNLKLAEVLNIPLYHYVQDTQELDYDDITNNIDYKRLFQYNSEIFKTTRHDSFLDFYMKKYSKIDFPEKDLDFVFGYTVVTKDRINDFLSDEIFKIEESFKAKIFLKDKFKNIDTFVKKPTYLNYLRRSKFTLIIPPYDVKMFSTYRFFESILNNCVPLILNTNNISEFEKDFYIPPELIIDLSELKKTIKTKNYNDLLKQLIENLPTNLKLEIKGL